MIRTTRDPISLNDVVNPDQEPNFVLNDGKNQLKIYFESELNRQLYLEMEVEHPIAVPTNDCEEYVAEG